MDNYKSGWYRFAVSGYIKQHQVYSFHYFDTALVCFRDKNNVVNIFDAHCPHLGAHLGVGGKIKDDHLICPFHGWQYNSEGLCVKIPYCNVIPKKAVLKRYISKEINSIVYIHHFHSSDNEVQDNESNNEWSIPDVTFKSLRSLQVSNLDFMIWYKRAQTDSFNFKSLHAGFLYDDIHELLISFTPKDSHHVLVDFSYATKKTFHLLLAYSIKRRAKNKFSLLIKT